MEIFLTLASGLGWIIVYEECIRLGLKQKTYAMPFFALGLNFAWELIYTLADIFLEAHGPLEGMTLVQTIANAAWVCLDVVILSTYFRFGRKEWPRAIDGKYFVPWSLLGLVCCFALQIAFIVEFDFFRAAEYSAFLQNLLMSVLFIALYVRRGNMEGQSILLAVAKWIGTLAPTLLMGAMQGDALVLASGIFCSVFDLIYIALLATDRKRQGCAEGACDHEKGAHSLDLEAARQRRDRNRSIEVRALRKVRQGVPASRHPQAGRQRVRDSGAELRQVLPLQGGVPQAGDHP